MTPGLHLKRWTDAPYWTTARTTANNSYRAWTAMLQDSTGQVHHTDLATPILDANRNMLYGSHAVCPMYDNLSPSIRRTIPGDVVVKSSPRLKRVRVNITPVRHISQDPTSISRVRNEARTWRLIATSQGQNNDEEDMTVSSNHVISKDIARRTLRTTPP
jgi:hypothetical protein